MIDIQTTIIRLQLLFLVFYNHYYYHRYRYHHCNHHHFMLCAIGLYMYCRSRSSLQMTVYCLHYITLVIK